MKSHPQIKLEYGEHRDKAVVFIRFKYDPEIIDRLKRSIPAALWSKSKGCWFVSEGEFNLKSFQHNINEIAEIDTSRFIVEATKHKFQLGRIKYPYRKKIVLPPGYMERLEQKRYSPSTISVYSAYFKDFIHFFEGRDLNEINVGEINEYVLSLIQLSDISGSEQNQRINAIKFYYEKVLGRERQVIQIERPRKEKKLPDTLSKEEIQSILEVTANLKHRCMLELLYSAGLRRGELLNLKINDIESKRMLIKIRGAKGKKDRYTLLSPKVLEHLRQYFIAYKPAEWLFEGQNGSQYTSTSITRVLKNSALKAGIKKRVHLHMLRHSFATHLLEQGTNLRVIQNLLGHENIQTTEIYTHVSNLEVQKVINPIDDILKEH